MNSEIYLDANATSPVLPAAIAAAQDALLACFGNPSSSHAAGLRARALLDDVRNRARRVLGAAGGRLLFTSGATEGIQTAVISSLCAVRARRAAGLPCGDLLVYGATEHKAVPESLAHWNALLGTNLRLQALPVDSDGRHRLDTLRALAPRVAFICTMAANNETGVVSDLDGIAAVLEETGSQALWMVDCVQALGKLPLDLEGTRIDYAPFSGHKLYAPKGIGMLYVRAGAPYTPLMCGGGQEDGQRSGTENMAGIAALGAVLRALEEGRTFRSHAQLAAARARLAAALRAAFPGIVFNAPFEHALPTTLADDAFIDAACRRIARCGQALGTLPPAPCPVAGSDAQSGAPLPPAPIASTGLIPCGLDGSALARFLDRHPDALLVDVREACEHALGTPLLHGRAAYSLPLSRLPDHAAWLGRETRPLVFFCRSGKRSAQAAQMARQLGHGNVRHLAGGLALLAP
jgi:cysteine sulfinate desulfinase/cysteine desulfurase-like protein/rhodanese-related sulfurtransferase